MSFPFENYNSAEEEGQQLIPKGKFEESSLLEVKLEGKKKTEMKT